MASPYLGQIIMFAGTFAPRGWALCNGQLLSINANTALFSILGTQFGGNGTTTFGLPNLQGRVVVGAGQLPGGGSYVSGSVGGSENVTLSVAQMPTHSHNVNADATVGTQGDPTNANIAEPKGGNRDGSLNAYTTGTPGAPVQLSTNTVAGQGGNQPHPNLQPYQVINYIIAIQGVFPSRN